jgi:hypothetical protein
MNNKRKVFKRTKRMFLYLQKVRLVFLFNPISVNYDHGL